MELISAIIVIIISSFLVIKFGIKLWVLIISAILIIAGGVFNKKTGSEGWGGSGSSHSIYWQIVIILGLIASIIIVRLKH